ncbi:MAG: FAD-dependent oxidoreductase [Eggerthellaceae bacterium]
MHDQKEGLGISKFLQGAGVTLASRRRSACSPDAARTAQATTRRPPLRALRLLPRTARRTMDVDIVVVGSGASGVAATVQAAELGATTLLLEKSDVTGGNGRLTEGMFALNSQMQKELGVGNGVTFTDIIAAEQEFFNYRINNLLWKDMANASGDNIDWMASHGVKFSGVVDDYHGLGKFDCFHWFVDGRGSNYIDPMLESAQSMGAVVMTETPALDLIVEDGQVKGLYAEKADGGILQVNAKAVILTSGGYAQNADLMAERGWDLTYSHNNGVEGHDGDGLRMAISAGAHDVSRERCFLREAYSTASTSSPT